MSFRLFQKTYGTTKSVKQMSSKELEVEYHRNVEDIFSMLERNRRIKRLMIKRGVWKE